MDLINDEDFVVAFGRCGMHMAYQVPNIFDSIIGCPILFDDIEGGISIHRRTARAFVARLEIGCPILAIQGLGEDTCASGFPHPSRSAEKKCVGHMPGFEGIFQGLGHMTLPDDLIEAHGSVFTGGNDVLFRHGIKVG